MKVELVKQKVSNEYGEDYRYKILNMTPCCGRIEHAKEIGVINPSDFYEYFGDEGIPGVAICWKEHQWSYGEEFEDDYAEQIKYCPFCGSPILVDIVKWEDVTERVSILEKEVDNLRKRYNRSGSIKKREELNVEMNKLQKEIDHYFSFGVYREN